jgi:hypothetical protein
MKRKKKEHLSKWKQQEEEKNAELKKVRARLQQDNNNRKIETPMHLPVRPSNHPSPSGNNTIATILNRPEPQQSSPEDDILKLLARLQEHTHKEAPPKHYFGNRGQILSHASPLQHSPGMEYGSRKLEADNSLPTVNIKVCMLNNQRITIVCNLNHTIADLYQHVNYLMSKPQAYLLKMIHPPVEFSDGTITVEKAQLRNALIHQVKTELVI